MKILTFLKTYPLFLILFVAFLMRILIPINDVFANGHINFLGNDSYWHAMRMEDIMASGSYGFDYDSAVVILAKILSFGQASPGFLHVVAVFTPPVIAVFTVFLVYLIARRIFSHRAGLFAALFLALWPDIYFARSLLGAIDHHFIEVFLTTGMACVGIYFITQKKILHWHSLIYVGVGAVFAVFFWNSWPGIAYFFKHFIISSPFVQPVLTVMTTTETLPLVFTNQFLPLIDFIIVIILGILLIKQNVGKIRWLLIAWGVLAAVMTLYQVRFDYYLAVPLAVMMGFGIARMFEVREVKKDAEYMRIL